MISVLCRIGDQYGMRCGDEVRHYTMEKIGQAIKYFITYARTYNEKGKPGTTALYVQDLDLIGQAIIKDIRSMGYKDGTEILGVMPQCHPKGSYQYLIGGDMGTWYAINVYRPDGYTIGIYALENVTGQMTTSSMLKQRIDGESDIDCILRVSYNIIDGLTNYTNGKTSLTISSWAMKKWTEYMPIYDRGDVYPDHNKIDIDLYGCTADEYVRKSYTGGWCWCNAEIGKVYETGITLDVNSLYPYVMYKNKFPVGKPHEWSGSLPELWGERIEQGRWMCFYHIAARFDVKDGYLPFIQIPGDFLHRGPQSSSKVINSKGEIDDLVEMWLTNWEFDLFKEHYDIHELHIYDGVCYMLQGKIFIDYVSQFYELKKAARVSGDKIMDRIAKSMLNCLSGGFAKKKKRSNALLDENGEIVNVIDIDSNAKSLIPIGACITSYARCYIVSICQANYDRFLYSDTDSAHLLGWEPPKGCVIDNVELGSMKIERKWDSAIFFGQKTYVEHSVDNGWELTYAGVPAEVQGQMEKSLDGISKLEKYFGVDDKAGLCDKVIERMEDSYKYDVEVSSGTYSVETQKMIWKSSVSDRMEHKKIAQDRYRHRKNRENMEKNIH